MAGTSLYLVIDATEGALPRLEAALAAARAEAVLIRPEPGTRPDHARLGALVAAAQRAGAAAIVADDARLARTLKADGVHLGPSPDIAERYVEAREILGTRGSIGVEPGTSRHDAMLLGEAGADYLAFAAHATSEDETGERIGLVAWWSEIFEVPCVALDVATPADAADLAGAGADFVAVTLPGASPPSTSADLARAVLAAISRATPITSTADAP